MNDELVATIAEIIKQAVSQHPNTIFSRQAFQIRIQNDLEVVIDQTLADLVTQGVIRNLNSSSEAKQAAYCLAEEHGGNEAATRQFFAEVVRITHRA